MLYTVHGLSSTDFEHPCSLGDGLGSCSPLSLSLSRPNLQSLASISLHLLTHLSTLRIIVLNRYVYVIVTMDAPADKSNWSAPRLADLRRQRSKPCWLYRHGYYLWIVKVDRETNHEDVPTTEIAENPESPGRGLNLDEMQDQLDGSRLSSSSYWQYSSEDAELNIDEVSSGSDENSLYGSSSSDSNHEIVAKRSEPAPATAAQVIKVNRIPDLQFSRLPSAGQPYTKYSGWELIPNPKILDNILQTLAAISQNFRVVPLEVKDDPFVAYHLHSRFGKERTIENMNVLALSPSPLGYDGVRLEITRLAHVQLASTRLQKRDLRFSRMFSPDASLGSELWHSTVHLPLMQLLRIQYPEFKVEQVRYTKPGVQSTAMYTSATPSNEVTDFRLSWEFGSDTSTDEEASALLDASLITFWPSDNPHDPVKIVVFHVCFKDAPVPWYASSSNEPGHMRPDPRQAYVEDDDDELL